MAIRLMIFPFIVSKSCVLKRQNLAFRVADVMDDGRRILVFGHVYFFLMEKRYSRCDARIRHSINESEVGSHQLFDVK